MATDRYYTCLKCGKRSHPHRLFDALLDFSKSAPKCQCGEVSELRVVPPFGLEAGSPDCKVLHVFLPKPPVSWELESGNKVTFYPFLVILRRAGEKGNSGWLPYWHVEDGGGTMKTKYGQWAPFMDDPQFESLVSQAREQGYFPL